MKMVVPQPRKYFKLGADEIDTILPASHFVPDTGSQELALSAISKLLGRDGTKSGLKALFASSPRPLVILGNIRRWALEGLRDDDLLRLLRRGPLVPPDPPMGAFRNSAVKAKASRSVTAKQARSVLANAFIGNVGGLDFRTMMCDSSGIGRSKMECLLVYFEACAALEGAEDDGRKITFDAIRYVPLWGAKSLKSAPIVGEGVVVHTSTMEYPTRRASAFVNFANPNYGYNGKFVNSCTQEEILQICCPEIMVGMLFIGKMRDDEVLNVRGVRRFCRYSGYLNSFQCLGPVSKSKAPPIQTVLTLDACYTKHFSEVMLWRDVSKAYYSFLELAEQHEGKDRPIVSTGKWGCGGFGGLAAHKMLQQVLAAAAAGVDLEFSAFGSHEGCDVLIAALYENKPSVGKVISLLQKCKTRETFVVDAVLFLRSRNNHGRSSGSGKGLTATVANMLGSGQKKIQQNSKGKTSSLTLPNTIIVHGKR